MICYIFVRKETAMPRFFVSTRAHGFLQMHQRRIWNNAIRWVTCFMTYVCNSVALDFLLPQSSSDPGDSRMHPLDHWRPSEAYDTFTRITWTKMFLFVCPRCCTTIYLDVLPSHHCVSQLDLQLMLLHLSLAYHLHSHPCLPGGNSSLDPEHRHIPKGYYQTHKIT